MLAFELIVIVLLILVNGFLALSELAVVSSRKSRLEYLANRGSRSARAALKLVNDPGRFLSTVQFGITLIGIVAGAFSGITLGKRLGVWLDTFPAISPHGDKLGIAVTVVGITYLSLVVGELVPKRVALARPEKVAAFVAWPMRLLAIVAAPAVWVLHVSTEAILRALHQSGVRESDITEEEVKSLIAKGTRTGVFAKQEQKMIDGVLRLADRPVRVIMTPRFRIVWIDAKAGRDMVIERFETNRFSRLLVCNGSVEHPVGAVHSKDLLPAALRGDDVPLDVLMTPLIFVPEQTPVLVLLGRFKKERAHMAVVVNEYGETEGIVTVTDILESIVGDLPERGEEAEPDIVPEEEGAWLVDGMTPIDEVRGVTGIALGPRMETMAGFMLHRLERVPEPGAGITYRNARFEIVAMDGNRIARVRIAIQGSRNGSGNAQ